MKTKLPRTWTKKFAWLPVTTTHGAWDSGRRVWLESVYYRYGTQYITEYMTKSDYDYSKQMLVEIKQNPDRYGDDPYRKDIW